MRGHMLRERRQAGTAAVQYRGDARVVRRRMLQQAARPATVRRCVTACVAAHRTRLGVTKTPCLGAHLK